MASTSTTSVSSSSSSSIATKSTSSSTVETRSTSSSSALGEPLSYKWLMGSNEIVSERQSHMKTKYYGDKDDISVMHGWTGGTNMIFEVTNGSTYPRHRGTVIIKGVMIDA